MIEYLNGIIKFNNNNDNIGNQSNEVNNDNICLKVIMIVQQ